VFDLIQTGFANRPDLAAMRSEALAAEARIRSERADRFPVISAFGDYNRQFYIDPSAQANNYSTILSISIPVFDGFTRKNEELKAREESEAFKNRVITKQQQIGLEIWTSYFRLTTSSERIKSTRNLLESASESYDVASGRYKEGVGSILDVLAAQSALETARAQDVVTRTEWLLSLAQLQQNMGILGIDSKKSIIFNNTETMGVNK
jgi:outer membrane protein TolC